MLKFTFQKFALPNESAESFRPVAVYIPTNTVEDLIERAAEKYLGMPKEQMLTAVNLFLAEASKALERGEALSTSLFNARPALSGTYNSMAEGVDTLKNPVRINFTPGAKAKDAAKKIVLQRLDDRSVKPQIFEVIDSGSGTTNQQLTPGNIITILGTRIKMLLDQSDNGVFLIKQDGSASEVKLDTISHCTAKKVIGLLPNTLNPGEYKIEIRSSYSVSGKTLKTLRTCSFDGLLSVE